MKCCENCIGIDYCQAGFWAQCEDFCEEFRKEAERVKEQIEYANKQHRVFGGCIINTDGTETDITAKSNTSVEHNKG